MGKDVSTRGFGNPRTYVGGLVERVLENIIKAYEVLKEVTGKDIPRDILERVLKEVEHIAIHELAHGAIRSVYPEIGTIEERDETLGECIDEVAGRFLEMYVSEKVGVYVHSFDEHVHELKHYASLSKLSIEAEELRKLYRHIYELIERGALRGAIDAVAAKCKEWIEGGYSGP